MSDFILTQLKRLADIFNREQDPEQMLEAAVCELREIFDADRAWILYPCDPGSFACQVRFEATRKEISETVKQDGCLSMTPAFARMLQEIQSANTPVAHVEGRGCDFRRNIAEKYNIHSQLAMVLRLKNDRPWVLGIHQCSSARRWTEIEIDLFQYTAERLRDAYDAGRLLATIQNGIAKRQEIDAELMRSEQRFRALFKYSGTSLWLEDFSKLKEGFAELRQQGVTSLESHLAERPEFLHEALAMFKVVDVNQATIDLYEADNKQHLLEDISRIFTDATMETFRAVLLALFAGNNHFAIEAEYKTLRGSILHTILNIDVLPAIESHMALITVTDISMQKDTEQRLLESRERYRLLMENANDAIFIADAETGMIMEANKKAADLLGRPLHEMVGMHQTELHPPEDREKYRKLFQERISSLENVGPHDIFVLRADGKKIPVEISPSVTVINGRTVHQGIFHDISRRLKTEERRRLLAIAVEQAAESVVITNTDGDVEYVNPAFERISGYTFHEVVGKNPRILKSDKTPSYHFQLLWKEIGNGKVWRGRFTNRKKDGTLFEEDATITPVWNGNGQIQHYVAVKRDITRQVLLEKQIKQSQKMQAIGTLAGGIAHDFNNILTAIMGFAEMSCLRSGHDEVLTSNLHEIVQAAERAGKLIEQILTFSRQTEKKVAPLQLAMIVKEVIRLLRASLPANIELVADVSSDLMVRADPTQMHQVIMNLCTNAYQALWGKSGWIRVSLERVQIDARKGVELGNLSQGNYVCLQVEDNGRGIPPEFIDRIFEPYFSTREKNEGTGLGLSVVHGIVNAHGGAVTVMSEPNKGSCFSVFLPEVRTTISTEASRDQDIPAGEGRVLLVDDEQQIVDYEIQVLEMAGYTTFGHTSSTRALKDFQGNHETLDVVITDMAMPDMTGLQLFQEVRRVSPEMPVILCTGYSEHVTLESAKKIGINGYLAKPFTAEQLALEVKKVLEGKRKD